MKFLYELRGLLKEGDFFLSFDDLLEVIRDASWYLSLFKQKEWYLSLLPYYYITTRPILVKLKI
jgi:hypothetical protein